MTDEQKKLYTLKISSANKTDLIVILYEITLVYIDEAEEAMRRDQKDSFRQCLEKAKSCLIELQNSINPQSSLAGNYFEIYLFLRRELSRAGAAYGEDALQNVKSILLQLLETYRKVSESDTSGPVMENSQAVYAGLTYGRNSLNENLVNQGVDRGFRA